RAGRGGRRAGRRGAAAASAAVRVRLRTWAQLTTAAAARRRTGGAVCAPRARPVALPHSGTAPRTMRTSSLFAFRLWPVVLLAGLAGPAGGGAFPPAGRGG